jgi:hypothetical protein
VTGESTHRFLVHDRAVCPMALRSLHHPQGTTGRERVAVRSILDGLHHEYGLETVAA